jgi:hypothetical protein
MRWKGEKAHLDDEGFGYVLLGFALLGTFEVGPVLSSPGAHGGGEMLRIRLLEDNSWLKLQARGLGGSEILS